MFPQARLIFYVPPISVWALQKFANAGELDNYIDSVFAVAEVGPDLYDFSIPLKSNHHPTTAVYASSTDQSSKWRFRAVFPFSSVDLLGV